MLNLRRFAWVVSFSALAALAACSSSSSKPGGLRQACFANGTCNVGLVCLSQVCVAAADGGAGMGGGGTAGSGGGTAGASGTGGASAGAGGNAAAGAGGAAAGQSGTDAGAGTSGTDAAAGTSGNDAAAGTTGNDAGADGAAGADAGACPYKASYGNVVIASNIMSAQEHVYPASNTQPMDVDSLQWSGVVRNAQIADTLDISFQSGLIPFGNTLTTMTGIDLSTQSDYQTCGACVILALALDANGDFLADPQTFISVSGTLNVTTLPAFPATATSRVTGSVSNVVFEHVSIDSITGVTTKLDNCQITLTSAAFDSPVTNQ